MLYIFSDTPFSSKNIKSVGLLVKNVVSYTGINQAHKDATTVRYLLCHTYKGLANCQWITCLPDDKCLSMMLIKEPTSIGAAFSVESANFLPDDRFVSFKELSELPCLDYKSGSFLHVPFTKQDRDSIKSDAKKFFDKLYELQMQRFMYQLSFLKQLDWLIEPQLPDWQSMSEEVQKRSMPLLWRWMNDR